MKVTMVLLLCAVILSGMAIAQDQKYMNAPLVVPNTTEEMQTPEFWINNVKGDPDEVILTSEQIKKMNMRNRSLPPEIKDINGDPYSIMGVINSKESIGLQFNTDDPLSIATFPGDSLRARLKRTKDYFEKGTYYYVSKKTYDEYSKAELYERTNEGSIPDVITPKYGILVTHTLNRVLPTHDAAYGSRDGWLDMLMSTSIDMAVPVAILHESKDKDWYYVRSEVAFGWIPAVNVALGSANEIRRYVENDDFVVSTTYKVPVYGDKNFAVYVNDLFIGSKYNLKKSTSSGYQVSIPIRRPDGSFDVADAWIKPDANVSEGYLPYTQRNIFNTAFNMLYRPYSWADASHEFDCCGTQRVLLKAFGINTGRWTSYILHATDNVRAFPKNTPKEEKYKQLAGCEGGICYVGSAGHLNMYIGEVNGRHYVLHQGGYTYKSEDGTVMEFKRVNVNDTELEGGSNIRDWTDIGIFRP